MNSLFPTFQDIGIYSEVCQNGTKTCTEQIVIYANAFTTCSVVQLFIGVVIGPLIDHFGLRVINIVSSAINFAGLLMFIFLTPSSAVIIFIASTLSGIGGSGMIICTLSAGQLFTRTSSMVVTLMQGVGDSSSGFFAFVHLAYKAGFSFRTSFVILALGALITGLLNSLFVQSYWLHDMPKYKEDATDEPRDGNVYEVGNEETTVDIRVDAAITEILPTPKRSMRSVTFLVALLFICLGLFQFNFYLAEFSILLDYYFDNPETTERLSSVFTFILLGGIPAAFLCGAIIDKIRSVHKPNLENLLALPSGYERNYAVLMYNSRPAAISMYIFAVLTVTVTSLQFIASEDAFYANFVVFLLMRGFLFTTFSITIITAFPLFQFGTIFGTTLTIGGIFSMIQYGLIQLNPKTANSIALILAFLLFIPPTIIYIMSSKALKKLPSGNKIDHCVPLKVRKILAVLLGSLEMCFSGVIYGMNSLFPTFQDIGIYSEVCQNGTKACTEQIVIYANAFTTCCVIQLFVGVVIGLLIDHVGLRVINMISSIIGFSGLLMFAFLTPSSAVIIFIASILNGIGGTGMVICTLSAGQLFTKTSSMVVTLIEGVYDSSSGLFAFVHLSHKFGFSFRYCFVILALGALITGLLNSLFVQSYWLQDMPKYKEDTTDEPRIKHIRLDLLICVLFISLTSLQKSSAYMFKIDEISVDIRVDAVITEILPTPKRSMRSLSFLVALMFFSLGLFQFNFYLAEFSILLDYYFDNPETTERLSSVFTFILLGGIPAAFLCGAIIDKIRSVHKPNLDHLLALPSGYERNYAVLMYNSRPAAISMYIFAVLTVTVTSLQFIALEGAFYANFVFFLLMRGFLFSTFCITVISAFPLSQYGTILGAASTLSGIFALIQYGLILPKPKIANSIALILAFLLFIPPTIIYIMSS
ncbi:unnamed protein product [Rodentolepis nana]|uniref:MFS domain-containing protein n=1 Tax=Rodentolepis nana TaxID=102285 RepID=A0A158QHQ1_RODNA|nr:unnamed protein product [Rodentolepis nana]